MELGSENVNKRTFFTAQAVVRMCLLAGGFLTIDPVRSEWDALGS